MEELKTATIYYIIVETKQTGCTWHSNDQPFKLNLYADSILYSKLFMEPCAILMCKPTNRYAPRMEQLVWIPAGLAVRLSNGNEVTQLLGQSAGVQIILAKWVSIDQILIRTH